MLCSSIDDRDREQVKNVLLLKTKINLTPPLITWNILSYTKCTYKTYKTIEKKTNKKKLILNLVIVVVYVLIIFIYKIFLFNIYMPGCCCRFFYYYY